MKWVIAKGWRQDNPAENIGQALPKVPKVQNHRKALPYDAVARCIGAVHASWAGHPTKLALEFLVLTAARSGEVREARWAEIDMEAKVWEIPAARMKMKRPHRVPLSSRAVALLKEAEALDDGSGLVFPGTKEGRPLSDMTLSKLVKELGFAADVHGFRTSFRTWALERTSFPREMAEAALDDLLPRNLCLLRLVCSSNEETDMRGSRFAEEAIIGMPKEPAAGLSAPELCRRHGISDATFYKWRSEYGGMEVSEAKRLIAEMRGLPCIVVSDNGTEPTSNAIPRWQEERGVGWHSRPGATTTITTARTRASTGSPPREYRNRSGKDQTPNSPNF